jgi:hypothetical protein
MATYTRFVYWHGLLTKDGGDETSCTVQAVEVTNPAGGRPAYARRKVISVLKLLPDGLYDLETHGEKHRVRHADGSWTTI